MTTKHVDYSVIFDNGGGITLQTDDGYVHHYDDPDQLAIDIKALRSDGTTVGWDGNEPEHKLEYDAETERNGGLKWIDASDVEATVKSGKIDSYGWNNYDDFFRALGVSIGDE